MQLAAVLGVVVLALVALLLLVAGGMRMIRAMAGRRHKVITAIAVRREDRTWHRDVVTTVRMRVLAEAEIQDYVRSGEWQGKAGGYGIQGLAGAFIPWISGSFTAVVGLPLSETATLLAAAGYTPNRSDVT